MYFINWIGHISVKKNVQEEINFLSPFGFNFFSKSSLLFKILNIFDATALNDFTFTSPVFIIRAIILITLVYLSFFMVKSRGSQTLGQAWKSWTPGPKNIQLKYQENKTGLN